MEYVLTQSAVQKLRRLVGGKLGDVARPANKPASVSYDDYAAPFTVRWSASENSGSGAWVIWLPDVERLAFVKDDFVEITGVTAAQELPEGWYVIDDASSSSTTVYLNATIPDDSTSGSSSPTCEISTTAATATTGETVCPLVVATMQTDSTTGAKSVKQFIDSAVTISGGAVDTDDASIEHVPPPEQGDPDGDEGRLQLVGWKDGHNVDQNNTIADYLQGVSSPGNMQIVVRAPQSGGLPALGYIPIAALTPVYDGKDAGIIVTQSPLAPTTDHPGGGVEVTFQPTQDGVAVGNPTVVDLWNGTGGGGGGTDLSDTPALDVVTSSGTASAGTAVTASRQDHVHKMPSTVVLTNIAQTITADKTFPVPAGVVFVSGSGETYKLRGMGGTSDNMSLINGSSNNLMEVSPNAMTLGNYGIGFNFNVRNSSARLAFSGNQLNILRHGQTSDAGLFRIAIPAEGASSQVVDILAREGTSLSIYAQQGAVNIIGTDVRFKDVNNGAQDTFLEAIGSTGVVTIGGAANTSVKLHASAAAAIPAPSAITNSDKPRVASIVWIDTYYQRKLTAGSNITIAADPNDTNKAKISAIVNDGVLTIKQGSTTLGTFSANQSTGTTVTIPAAPTVNNGTLTIKQGTTTLGTFTANQSSNKTITIPAPVSGTVTFLEDITWDATNHTLVKVWGTLDLATGVVTHNSGTPSGKTATIQTTGISSIIPSGS